MTTWPIPADVLPIYGASGTRQTCEAQGFFAQSSVSSVLYNGSLAIYFYLVIVKGWSQTKLDRSKIEVPMHAIAILWGLLTSSVSLGLGLINPIGWDCWISAVPIGCKESWLNGGQTTCIRGDNANLYQWIFFYAPLWLVILCVTIIMGAIVCHFRNRDAKNKRYGEASYRKSKFLIPLQKQSSLYVFSFYFVWIFPTILRIHELVSDVVYYEFVLLSAIFVPTQGFLNMIVYLSPRYQKIREKKRLMRLRSKQQIGEQSYKNASKQQIGGQSDKNVHDSFLDKIKRWKSVTAKENSSREGCSTTATPPPTEENDSPLRVTEQNDEAPTKRGGSTRVHALQLSIRFVLEDIKEAAVERDDVLFEEDECDEIFQEENGANLEEEGSAEMLHSSGSGASFRKNGKCTIANNPDSSPLFNDA